jgi:uncharacterized membrane protein YfcA
VRRTTLQIVLGWAFTIGAAIGWPLSALTFARDEPQTVLGLSWVALLEAGLAVLFAADVRREQERQNNH